MFFSYSPTPACAYSLPTHHVGVQLLIHVTGSARLFISYSTHSSSAGVDQGGKGLIRLNQNGGTGQGAGRFFLSKSSKR